MKLCDRCGCEATELTQLVAEFDGLECCPSCFQELVTRCAEIQNRLAKIRDRARQRAFAAWKGRDHVPIRVRRSFDSLRSLFALILHVGR